MSAIDISQTPPRAKVREDLLRRSERRMRLQTIVRLRWIAVLGQSVTVLAVYWLMGVAQRRASSALSREPATAEPLRLSDARLRRAATRRAPVSDRRIGKSLRLF